MTGYQCYATADLGLIAYETEAREGLVVDEGVIVEIVRPGTGDPVPEGEVGELVITTLNPDYPLIRLARATCPPSCLAPAPQAAPMCASKAGWVAPDQTTKVRGMFVHPGQVVEVAKRFPQIQRVRLVITGAMANDQMTLHVETLETAPGLVQLLQDRARSHQAAL